MKQDATNPDFIKDNKRPEGFNRLSPVGINKASFNGDTYSWSSDAGGWFKDNTPEPAPISREDEKPEIGDTVADKKGNTGIVTGLGQFVGTIRVKLDSGEYEDYENTKGNLTVIDAPTLYRDNVRLLEENKELKEQIKKEYKRSDDLLKHWEAKDKENKELREALHDSLKPLSICAINADPGIYKDQLYKIVENFSQLLNRLNK